MRLAIDRPDGHSTGKATTFVLSFGVTFMLDPPVSRTVEWAKLAEAQGFDAVWAWDSHVLWQEFYTTFALVAAGTDGFGWVRASPTRRRGT